MPYKDLAKRRAHAREYYSKHREERRAYEAAHVAERREYDKKNKSNHREERKSYALDYWETHKKEENFFRNTLRGRFSILKSGANARNIPCILTFEQYSEIAGTGTCFYCSDGLPLMGGGLDRKNSSEGYSAGNCVPCCTACNTIRGKDLISHSEMIEVANLLKKLRSDL